MNNKEKWNVIKNIRIGSNKIQESCDVIDLEGLNQKFITTDLPSKRNGNSNDSSLAVRFEFMCATSFDVYQSICSIKSNAESCDDINPKFVKILLPKTLPYITYIFNNITYSICLQA